MKKNEISFILLSGRDAGVKWEQRIHREEHICPGVIAYFNRVWFSQCIQPQASRSFSKKLSPNFPLRKQIISSQITHLDDYMVHINSVSGYGQKGNNSKWTSIFKQTRQLICDTHVAKPSFSHKWVHHSIVTRLPNHWWASSCAITIATFSHPRKKWFISAINNNVKTTSRTRLEDHVLYPLLISSWRVLIIIE